MNEGSEQHLRRARPGSLHFTWGSSSANREAVASWRPGCHGLTCADMGNQLSNPRYSQPDSLAELPMPVVFKDNLGEDERHRLVLESGCALRDRLRLAGGGRLFKTSLCLHDEGGLVAVKVRSC